MVLPPPMVLNLYLKDICYYPRAQLKKQRSCSLLKKTGMEINQISYMIGIDDSLYFSRLFSKIMGMSPRDYCETAVA